MERKFYDFWVGLFLLAGFFALALLVLQVGSFSENRSAKTYNVEASFENIGGLKMKAPVKSAGVLVGRVTNIRFDNDKFKAVVTLAMDNNFKFPKDSNASILTSGLLGEVYVGLDPGGDDKNLQAGDTIKLTQSAVVLEKLIGQMLFSKASEGSDKGNDKAADKK